MMWTSFHYVSHYDTVASLYYKLENKGKAKKYAKKGIKFAKSQGESHDGLTELMEMINGGSDAK